MKTGSVILDLEKLAVTKDGESFHNVDFNFWGVTFVENSERFYATLGTGGQTYLVEGNLDTQKARVLRPVSNARRSPLTGRESRSRSATPARSSHGASPCSISRP